ncbi:MAG: hypothetical protein BWY75_01619 [bacterium ADurb.Bin425]|nr:MAG: hypothetical protein BWY75_01619 [bacterium ADurb.Bin425]
MRNLIRSKRAELDLLARALVEKETLRYRDLVAILEPHRTKEDIDKEIFTHAERKQVGTPPIVSLDLLSGLKEIASLEKNGKNGTNSSNGNHAEQTENAEQDAGQSSQDSPENKEGQN